MRIVFAGTPAFSVQTLDALLAAEGMDVVGVVSQPDRRAGRGMKLTPSPIKKRALEAGIDVITPLSLKGNDEALQWLQQKQADFLVLVAFGMLLPPSWLQAARLAPVNVHASLLPRWRGAAPIERALLAGDLETGVCIMHMEEGLDTGGIYACRKIAIDEHITGAELWAALADMGAGLLVETLPNIAQGLQPTPQATEGVTYAAKLRNDERCIRWTEPAVHVDRLVRCFSPRPGARCKAGGRWLKIISGTVVDAHVEFAPGTVLTEGSMMRVVCGDGSLYRIEQLQPEGKKAMSAADYLRGASFAGRFVLD